jgi:phosphoribosyl-ATP pyrophosphohydrolase/phosphoribosyl-AMP cyclohydrolase
MARVKDLKWNDDGLLPAVAQDRLTGQVRMLAWMNREALEATLRTGFATFYSRSRRALWQKGETSGNALRVQRVVADCDADTLLLLVDPAGPSCHTGRETCFFETVESGAARADVAPRDAAPFLALLEDEIRERAHSTAAKSYTRSLLDGGVEKINAKIQEEAGELCAALRGESDERVANEAGDVIYHLLVGLRARGIEWRRVMEVLAARAGRSGHAEKASRGG